jgi:hypothetical protein
MVHAINALVPSLIPASAPLIAQWLTESGLDATIMEASDAASAAAMGGDCTPRVFGTLAAMEVVEAMQTDGWNYLGRATSKTGGGECKANCRPFADSIGTNFLRRPMMLNPSVLPHSRQVTLRRTRLTSSRTVRSGSLSSRTRDLGSSSLRSTSSRTLASPRTL